MVRPLIPMEEEADAVRDTVARAKRGERAAADALVRRHAHAVYGLLFRVVGNHEDAEDLTQETFVRALRALELYRDDAPFEGWLLRIAVHLGRDHLRRLGRAPRTTPLLAVEPSSEAASDPSEREHDRQLQRALQVALDGLPTPLRAALALRVLEGREYDEVAAALGVKPATARTQVMKARKLLARFLAPWIGGQRDSDRESGGHTG